MAHVNNIEEYTSFNAVNNAGNQELGVEIGLPGIPSKAAIQGHPIHPILVTMPVSMLFTAFITDWLHVYNHDRFWARATRMLLGAGLVTGVISALTGLVDFLGISRVRAVKAGWIHLIGNGVALLVTWLNLSMRRGDKKQVPMAARILSTIVALLLGITGWYGGQLIYKHKIAVQESSHTAHRT